MKMKYLEVLKLKKGILINFPQVSKDGRGEVEVRVVYSSGMQ